MKRFLDSSDFEKKKAAFAAGFPKYKNEKVPALDKKHAEIIKELELSEDWLASFQENEIRTWRMQDDIGHSPYLLDYMNREGTLANNLTKFFYHKVRWRKGNSLTLASIRDDISIIESLNGTQLLIENPVDRTPGKPRFTKVNNYRVNARWLRYIYLANNILTRGLLPDGGTWLDIGSYYGGIQGIVFKYKRTSKIIMVDFHHQLFRSYAYLSELFPDATHNLGIEATLRDCSNGSINYVHVSDFNSLKNINMDLVSNFFSFGEMKRETFSEYVRSPVIQNATNLFTVNRFISSPFFEKTYDSDLSVFDYYFSDSRSLSYFDIFPIHHFAMPERELFGIKRPRNTSSPYFEGIWRLRD